MFRYAPSTVLPSPTTSSWDPVYRPTMRPITLSHDANRQVRYDEDVQAKKKKLVFFKQKDAWRNPGEYTREEL
jgi:hypothetical protein